MVAAINVLILILAVLVLVPVSVFCVECLLGMLPRRRMGVDRTGPRPSVAILVPAHNEELVIGATLRSLLPQLNAGDRIVVVAHNCDDRTAAIARDAGVTVVEHSDPQRRGKGYALDFGVSHLRQDPPEVVLVIDADCEIGEGAVDKLARLASCRGRPVQAHYVTRLGTRPGPLGLVSALAFRFRGLVRVLGLARLGLPCHLMGTGMAFPWAAIRDAPLASGNLVEDMQLGIDLLIAGHPPLFCPEAEVATALPRERKVFVSQRRRWDHGHLQTAASQVPRLLWKGIRQRRPGLFFSALDLCVPPLALLVLSWLGVTGLAVAAGLLGGSWLAAGLLASGGLLLAATVFLGWFRFCREQVPWFTFLAVPLYLLWKLPIYAGLLLGRQREWVRTPREPASPNSVG